MRGIPRARGERLQLPGERRVYDCADGDEQQGDRVRFVKELEGDVVDRPLVDAREAVGPGAKSTIVDMVDDVGVSLPEYYRHPRCFARFSLVRSPSMEIRRPRCLLAPNLTPTSPVNAVVALP